MKDTEQLELEYLRIKNERDIEGFEKENLNEKLLESALFIKQYCEETSCYSCMFYTSSGMYEECCLSGKSPNSWKKIKIER